MMLIVYNDYRVLTRTCVTRSDRKVLDLLGLIHVDHKHTVYHSP